jgi:hypothetical protein
LAFVPPALVEEAFETVVSEFLDSQRENNEDFRIHLEEIDDVHNYYERTYIGPIVGRQRTRRQPLFPIALWNKYEEVLEEVDITNNRAEGFNSGWSSTMQKTTTLYTVLEGFLQQESWAEMKLREDVVAVGGTRMTENRNKRLLAIQRRLDLKALCESWNTMPLSTYMDSLVKYSGYIEL